MEKLKIIIIKTKKTKQKSNNHNNKQKIDKTKRMGVARYIHTSTVTLMKVKSLAFFFQIIRMAKIYG